MRRLRLICLLRVIVLHLRIVSSVLRVCCLIICLCMFVVRRLLRRLRVASLSSFCV